MHDVLKTRSILETYTSFHFIINFQKKDYIIFIKKIFIYRSFWVSMTQQKATVYEQLYTHIVNYTNLKFYITCTILKNIHVNTWIV